MTDKFQSFITVFMRVDTIIAETNMLRKLTKRRAVSPVIATVILVAVTITVAVAVSYWMSGITGQYTSFEKVEIQTAICTYTVGTPDYWQIIVTLKNSGTKAATLTHIFVNEIEVNCTTVFEQDKGISGTVNATNTLPILSGASDTITVWIEDVTAVTLSSGTTINIKIHSASGMDYIKLVQLT
jgi:flagellin-like protein